MILQFVECWTMHLERSRILGECPGVSDGSDVCWWERMQLHHHVSVHLQSARDQKHFKGWQKYASLNPCAKFQEATFCKPLKWVPSKSGVWMISINVDHSISVSMIMMILNMYWDRTNHVNSLHEYHESLECVSCFFSWLIIRHHQRVIRGSNWVEINDHESTWDFPNMEMSLSIWWINTLWWTIVKAVSEQTVGIILFYFLNGSILMLFISHTITLQQLILVYCSPLSLPG